MNFKKSISSLKLPHYKGTAAKASVPVAPPSEVLLPMNMHSGQAAEPVVAVGDYVRVGQLIAREEGRNSSPVYASISGTVAAIEPYESEPGRKTQAILIKGDGKMEVDPSVQPPEIHDLDSFLAAVRQSGIVGLGGAAFPLWAKLDAIRKGPIKTVLINGAECEPFITSDHRTMVEHSDLVVKGVALLKEYLHSEEFILGIENNKPDAIDHLTRLAASFSGITIQPLALRYPQGGEKQLIDACIGRQIPSGKLPIDVGAVVQNVGTAYAVYEAVQKNKPLIERVVCVTGKTLARPSNFLVRIGTPVEKVIEAAGGVPDDCGKVIGGGPMMGRAFTHLDVPVIKGTSGILLMSKAESQRAEPSNCIRCAKCVSVCPMGLEPFLLAKVSAKGLLDRAEAEHIMDCIECGSCSFTCPSNRPLLDYIRLGKGKVGAILRARAAAAKK